MSELLDQLIEYERRGGRVLFWACPAGCDGMVNWTQQPAPFVGPPPDQSNYLGGPPVRHIATCAVCGRTNWDTKALG